MPLKAKKGKPIRVAFTGATGFTGTFVLPQLLAAGHEVVALARDPKKLEGKCGRVIKGDLADVAALEKLVEGADVVIHNAGATSGRTRNDFFEANVEGTKRLFVAARAAKIQRFVYISSITAREPELSDYGASKAMAEKYLLPHDDEDLDVLVIRPPAIYGPGDTSSLPLFKQLLAPTAYLPGRKNSRFSMIHVADVAKVICESVDATAHAIFELDDQSVGYSWDDVIAISRELTGYPKRVVHLPHGLAHGVAGLIEFAARVRGKTAFTSRQKIAEIYHDDWVAHGWLWPVKNPIQLKEGFAQTLKWYQDKGWLKPVKQEVKKSA